MTGCVRDRTRASRTRERVVNSAVGRRSNIRATGGLAGVDPGTMTNDLLHIGLVTVHLLLSRGATAHAGVGIPLGFGTLVEPLLMPAAIIEGAGAVDLGHG
jgi:hypothetical protein